ncbi:Oidioi.mRNA.OKI2018_I69.PAR.g13183.t2.cds [Oikopleura dioica]|uniref:Oidioi.mRNA.OKI2018_I69.PAR.g13183.t2.cds n=1 Tax=Oikopleura dioica TaxID=34765 RepID=A0ABN7SAD7_OIKDI|nr:Oidioi.mRNA.OKI2018_I69.PAR.g13183.t2.cds [Oikopleura dioica]
MNKFKPGELVYERSEQKIVPLTLCTKPKDTSEFNPNNYPEKRLRQLLHRLTTNTDTGFNLLEDIFECMVMNDIFQSRMTEEARIMDILGLRRIGEREENKTIPYHGYLRTELAEHLGNLRLTNHNNRSRKSEIDPSSILSEGSQRRTRSQTSLMNKKKEPTTEIAKTVKQLFEEPSVKKNFNKIFQTKRRIDPISPEEIEQWQQIINKKARKQFSDPGFLANLQVPTLRKSELPSSEEILDILPLDLSIGH